MVGCTSLFRDYLVYVQLLDSDPTVSYALTMEGDALPDGGRIMTWIFGNIPFCGYQATSDNPSAVFQIDLEHANFTGSLVPPRSPNQP